MVMWVYIILNLLLMQKKIKKLSSPVQPNTWQWASRKRKQAEGVGE